MFVQQGPWHNDITMEFIDNYRRESVLWDPKHPDYKNKVVLSNAWEIIKDNMSIECSVVDLKKKKESLMASYRLQNRRRRENPNAQISWFAFERMDSFLGSIYNCDDNSLSDQELLNNSEDHQYFDKIKPIKRERPSVSSTSKYTPQKRSNDILTYGYIPTPERDTHRTENSEMDECELYGRLLAKKMRRLDERQRELVMHEIDNLVFRARMNSSINERNSSKKGSRIKSPDSPVFIVTDHEQYEEEYLEDPVPE